MMFYGDGVGLSAEETKFSFSRLDLLSAHLESLGKHLMSSQITR